MPLKGYVCHRLFVEGKQSKQTHALKDRNYQPKVQILVDRVLTEAAKQALDVLEVQQEAFDGHLHLPLVDGLAHHLYQRNTPRKPLLALVCQPGLLHAGRPKEGAHGWLCTYL